MRNFRMNSLERTALVFTLIVALVLCSASMAFASYYDGGNPTTQENIDLMCAYSLHDMGLFEGTSKGFELNTGATRLQGMIMFIRILGQEGAAMAGGTDTTFSDVPSWGKAYAAFAEKQGLTKGLGNGLFGANDAISAKDYATFLLRGLNYSDADGDFSYSDSVEFLHSIGTLNDRDLTYIKSGDFTRGKMVLMSYRVLCTAPKGGNFPLVDRLGYGSMLEAEYHPSMDGEGCSFQIALKTLTNIKDGKKVSHYSYSPVGYKYPLDKCFLYVNIDQKFRVPEPASINSLEYMTSGAASDDGTIGQFSQVMVFYDVTLNELGMVRYYTAMENEDAHIERFIVTPYVGDCPAPKAVTNGISCDKTTGMISLDNVMIASQIGSYSKVYYTSVHWPFDNSDESDYKAETAVMAFHGRYPITCFGADTSNIQADFSKYNQLLLFVDADGNAVGYKSFAK